jgi:hypothetical protein
MKYKAQVAWQNNNRHLSHILAGLVSICTDGPLMAADSTGRCNQNWYKKGRFMAIGRLSSY